MQHEARNTIYTKPHAMGLASPCLTLAFTFFVLQVTALCSFILLLRCDGKARSGEEGGKGELELVIGNHGLL